MPSPSVAHAALAFSTACGWLTLVVLATIPSGAWPHVGLCGNVERVALFFLVAGVTRAAMTKYQTRWQIAGFAAAAILFEVSRAWIAGQSNGVMGWMSSTAGVIVGAALLRHVAHTSFRQWGVVTTSAPDIPRFVAFSTIDDESWEAGPQASALLDRGRELSVLGIGLVRFTEILDCGSDSSDVLSEGTSLPEARGRFQTVFRGDGVPELAPVALQGAAP